MFLRPGQSIQINLPFFRLGQLKDQPSVQVRLRLTTNTIDMTGFEPIDRVIKYAEFESEPFRLDF
jgi:hypothetical protein